MGRSLWGLDPSESGFSINALSADRGHLGGFGVHHISWGRVVLETVQMAHLMNDDSASDPPFQGLCEPAGDI